MGKQTMTDLKLGLDETKETLKTKKLFLLVIDEQENELNYHPVGVDGNVYQIQRGVEVEVPEEVVAVLKNAVATKLVKEYHEGKETYVPRNYSIIPYRILGSRTVPA
jgi:hypothetical protein